MPFEVIADCLNFGHFAFRAPFGGIGSTYTIHLRLIGNRVVDVIVVLIELFSVAVTAEALRAKVDGQETHQEMR